MAWGSTFLYCILWFKVFSLLKSQTWGLSTLAVLRHWLDHFAWSFVFSCTLRSVMLQTLSRHSLPIIKTLCITSSPPRPCLIHLCGDIFCAGLCVQQQFFGHVSLPKFDFKVRGLVRSFWLVALDPQASLCARLFLSVYCETLAWGFAWVLALT